MKKIFLIFIIMFGLLLPMVEKVGAKNPYIVDETNTLTNSQLNKLESKLEKISNTYGIDVVIYRTSQEYYSDNQIEMIADDYWDNNDYGQGSDHSGILFVITSDNSYYFSTCGKAITYFTDYGLELLSNYFYDSYQKQVGEFNDKLFNAMMALADKMEGYIHSAQTSKPIDYYYNRIVIHLTNEKGEKINGYFWVYENGEFCCSIHVKDGYGMVEIQTINDKAIYEIENCSIDDGYELIDNFVISGSAEYDVTKKAVKKSIDLKKTGYGAFGVGGLISLIYSIVLVNKNKSVSPKMRADDYLRRNSFRLKVQRDAYLYSNTTRTRRPRHDDNNGTHHSSGGSFSGGSSTHISSSGVRHGGGGHGRL